MVYVNNKNIGEIAKTYFADCPFAFNDAIRYVKKYKCPKCEGLKSTHSGKCFACDDIKSWKD